MDNFEQKIQEKFEWVKLPPSYLKVIQLNLCDIEFWSIKVNAESIISYSVNLKTRFPERDLVIFAKRNDNDLIACWERGKPGKAVIINDFASGGYENEQEYETFWDWFRAAIELMIDEGD
ncbi:hypothetical protein LJR235_005047 [Pararhizobium sp. LjRoot235]|uniref:hypothetical protein n=1 Tax=Pararhizobium sp. LjRoot235 TaxID=3342291 RepID=UPI003ED03CA0